MCRGAVFLDGKPARARCAAADPLRMTPSFKVPILIREDAGFERRAEAVRLGVPLPRGCMPEGVDVDVVDDAGRALPCQYRRLSLWSDRSVKWLLVDVLTDVAAYGLLRLFLVRTDAERSKGALITPGLEVIRSGSHVRVATGKAV